MMAKEVKDPDPQPEWWDSLTHECALPTPNNRAGTTYIWCQYCGQRWMLQMAAAGLRWIKS